MALHMLMLLPVVVCSAVLMGIFFFLWRTLRHPSTLARKVLTVLGAVVVGGVLFFCMWRVGNFHLAWYQWARALNKEIERGQRLILYQTDHRAVLEAGRQVLADTNTFSSFPSNESLPKPLRDLAPSYVIIAEDRSSLDVEMGGGFFHYGCTIYQDDAAGRGVKQLIPGLWYNSEDGKVISPKP
jgi:hypothetical protein